MKTPPAAINAIKKINIRAQMEKAEKGFAFFSYNGHRRSI